MERFTRRGEFRSNGPANITRENSVILPRGRVLMLFRLVFLAIVSGHHTGQKNSVGNVYRSFYLTRMWKTGAIRAFVNAEDFRPTQQQLGNAAAGRKEPPGSAAM